jgi:hypothetical protein
MAPFLVAAFDIECTSARRLPVPSGHEKTARELVIWAGEQMQAHQGEGLDDMEDAFPSSTRRGGRRARAQQGLPQDGQGVRPCVCLPQVHRERRHNIIGSKLSNTEKIERLAELLNKCALTRPARPSGATT